MMINGIPNISLPTISYLKAYSGKTSLPVESSSLMYSHFEHVSGIPAPAGTQGVSISKLNLLDVLIGQINQIKTPTVQSRINSYEGADSLIESYRKQISEMNAAHRAMPYISSPGVEGGALFKLLS